MIHGTRVTLGHWPNLALRQARLLAETKRQELENPIESEQLIFEALASDWVGRFINKYSKKRTI